jgi:hypothetical protein
MDEFDLKSISNLSSLSGRPRYFAMMACIFTG